MSKIDPTRTISLRKKFAGKLSKPFRELKGQIRTLVVEKDAFGLRQTRNARFDFETDVEKLEAFDRWLKDQMEKKLIRVRDRVTDRFVREGFERGIRRAFEGVRRVRSVFESPTETQIRKNQFIVTLMRTDIDRLRFLQERTFRDLKGVNDAMAQQISRVLSDGLLRGDRPEVIATALNERVEKIGITRARTIARTEIIRAHAEGALDAMERLGVKDVSVHVEWRTASDPCELCEPLRGVVMTIDQARGMFPRHPNCRCSPIPTEEERNRQELRKAVRKSIRRAKGSGSWKGPGKTSKKRRKVRRGKNE